MAAKQQNKTWAAALKLVASLIFLYVVFVSPPSMTSSGITAALLWAPLLYAMAVIGSIALFLASLMSFSMSSEMLSKWSSKAMMATTLAVIAWAAIAGGVGLGMTTELAIVAFVIGIIGSGAEQMK
jgi:hypothetical protein